MPNLADFGLTLDASGAIQNLRAFGAEADKAATRVRGLQGAADQSVPYVRGLAQASTDAGRQMGLAEIQAYKMATSQGTAAAATGMHGLQLGRLNMELGTAIGRFTGLNTAATRLAGQIGGSIAGYGQMIAVLGGIVAVSVVWKAWHEEAGKAKEQQDKLTESLGKWYEKQKEGPAGALPKQIEAMTAHIKDLRKELDALTSGSFFASASAAGGQVGAGGSKAMAWLRILTAGDFMQVANQFRKEFAGGVATTVKGITEGGKAIIAAQTKTAEEIEAAAVEARAAAITQQTDLLQEGLAKPGVLQRMRAEIEEFTRLSKQFAASGDITHALEYANAADKLREAIEKETAAERARADALAKSIEKTNEHIAKLTVDVDAQQRMAAAKAQGQDVEDRLTVSLAAEAAARELVDKAMPRQIEKVVALTRAKAEGVIAARKAAEAEKDLADSITEGVKALVAAVKEADKIREQEAKAAERYAADMRKDWMNWVEQVTTSGLHSFTAFFDSVYRLFTRMLERMQAAGKGDTLGAKLLGLGGAALGGGLGGYQIGQSSGSAVTGALGGAAAGALAGSAFGPIGTAVGALSGFIGGILGAGNAAKEAAKQMDALRLSLASSIAAMKATLSGDVLGQAIAQLHAQFEALRKNTEDAYANGNNEAARNVILAQLNSLEAQRTKQLQDEEAVVRTLAARDLEVRMFVAQGRLAEGSAMAFALAQQREMIAAQKDTTAAGVAYAAALGLVQVAEAGARDAAIKQADADRRAAEARGLANIGLRIMTATNDPGLRAEQERLEIEALVASGASAATIALTKLAQAAEDAATSAQQAAAAQQKLADQQRALQDLSVELLRAKGQTGAAADLQFQLDQQRRLDDAKANQSGTYVTKLLQLQQIQRDQRAAQQLIDSTTGPSGGRFAGATQALAAVSAVVTDRTALMLVDLTRSEVTLLTKIELNTRSGGGGNGGATVISPHFYFTAKLTEEDYAVVRDRLIQEVDEAFGNRTNLATLHSGSVGRH